MLKIEIQKVKVILFAVLLGAGFAGGQAWGSKELTFEEWKESNDQKAQEFKKRIDEKQKQIESATQMINELKKLIEEKEVFCKTENYKKLVEVEKELQQYKDNEQFELNAPLKYLEEKPKKIKELNKQLKELEEIIEQRKKLGEEIQRYQFGNGKGFGIDGASYYLQERERALKIKKEALAELNQKKQLELDKKNKEKEEKEKQQKEQLRRNSFLLQRNSLIYSFISGMLSSFKLGIDFANNMGSLNAIKNNWKLCGLGAAASGLTTGYNYKKLSTLKQDNPTIIFPNKKSIVTNSLVGHGLGVVTGMVMGYGMQKIYRNLP